MSKKELREIWDDRAQGHAVRKRSRDKSPDGRLYDQSWWRHIEPLLPDIAGGRILEAGCGPGRWVDRLAPLGFEVVLSDISPKMIETAREFVQGKGYEDKVQFLVADIGDMGGLADGSFDMALATGEPVSMCSSPQQAISELCRVVRPGGYVLCDAGNRYRRAYDLFRDDPSGPVLRVLETGEYLDRSGLALHLLGPEELAAVFRGLGMELLTVAGITPMFTFPPSEGQKKALKDPDIARDMDILDQAYSRHPSMAHLSQRIIAVARKPG